jgi:hypothetical protein
MRTGPSLQEVEQALVALFLGGGVDPASGAAVPGLRREDRKKSVEVTALLAQLGRLRGPVRARRLLVDAAAGHAYVGLLAAHLLRWPRVVLLERDPQRLGRAAAAAAALRACDPSVELELRTGDVADGAAWPERPDVVVGLHACGRATDDILDQATRLEARFILLVPCCYGRGVPMVARAEERAEALGLPRQAEVRRRFVQALVDGERLLRLEARGWEVTAEPLVAPTVTPHNLLLRARRVAEPVRAAEAARRWEALVGVRFPG